MQLVRQQQLAYRFADRRSGAQNQQPGLVGLFDGFRAHTPQLYVDVDREKVKKMGVALSDVFDALQAYSSRLSPEKLVTIDVDHVRIPSGWPLTSGRGTGLDDRYGWAFLSCSVTMFRVAHMTISKTVSVSPIYGTAHDARDQVMRLLRAMLAAASAPR